MKDFFFFNYSMVGKKIGVESRDYLESMQFVSGTRKSEK